MPLPSDLLNPISADKPGGENLQYAPVFDKIKEARREDDDVPQGEWARGRKLADWPLTIKLINETLSTKTKDLQLTAWLAEAMLKREGISGLREVLDLNRAYIENFWDSLYPELEDGDAEFRAGKLQWIGDKLDQAVKQVPLTRTGLSWYSSSGNRARWVARKLPTPTKSSARGGRRSPRARSRWSSSIRTSTPRPRVFTSIWKRPSTARWNRSACWERRAMRSSATFHPVLGRCGRRWKRCGRRSTACCSGSGRRNRTLR